MRLLHTPLAIAGALLVAALGTGCHLPSPNDRAVLHIASGGSFTLDGQPIDPATLPATIAARNPSGAGLLVEVRASPSADIQVVSSAIESLKRSHVHIAFAREDGSP